MSLYSLSNYTYPLSERHNEHINKVVKDALEQVKKTKFPVSRNMVLATALTALAQSMTPLEGKSLSSHAGLKFDKAFHARLQNAYWGEDSISGIKDEELLRRSQHPQRDEILSIYMDALARENPLRYPFLSKEFTKQQYVSAENDAVVDYFINRLRHENTSKSIPELTRTNFKNRLFSALKNIPEEEQSRFREAISELTPEDYSQAVLSRQLYGESPEVRAAGFTDDDIAHYRERIKKSIPKYREEEISRTDVPVFNNLLWGINSASEKASYWTNKTIGDDNVAALLCAMHGIKSLTPTRAETSRAGLKSLFSKLLVPAFTAPSRYHSNLGVTPVPLKFPRLLLK